MDMNDGIQQVVTRLLQPCNNMATAYQALCVGLVQQLRTQYNEITDACNIKKINYNCIIAVCGLLSRSWLVIQCAEIVCGIYRCVCVCVCVSE